MTGNLTKSNLTVTRLTCTVWRSLVHSCSSSTLSILPRPALDCTSVDSEFFCGMRDVTAASGEYVFGVPPLDFLERNRRDHGIFQLFISSCHVGVFWNIHDDWVIVRRCQVGHHLSLFSLNQSTSVQDDSLNRG